MVRDSTAAVLRRTALDRQRSGRVPGLHASVVRHGELLWEGAIGTAEVGTERVPSREDQFLVASNTKTFVATMVMQLRDEGRLSLEDRLADHLPGLRHDVTVRDALSHVSGLQREPVGDVWVTLRHPDEEALLREADSAEALLRAGEQWHYSNLAFALLGQVVARLDGRAWHESLRARLLEPLGMTRTSVGFDGGSRAHGYYVGPYDDVPRAEPVLDLAATGPAGALASTATDLARWTAFVADPDPDVLAPATMDEMTRPRAFVDAEGWQMGMGLGFFLLRSPGGRVLAGHTGGMPGHVTGVFTDRATGTAGVVLMNASTPGDPAGFAAALVDVVLDREPPEPEPWRPGTTVPDDLRPLLGRWWSEGRPWDFSVRQGQLEVRSPDWPADREPWTFERVGPDVLRTTTGAERHEPLRVLRGPDGGVESLRWATYRVTREPLGFGEEPSAG
ncbi:beta-lactamase family protein [Phycicoccus endophyticus]|uniref:Beta-lactamase family protein n=1 Tax=Phycicoccus endophyticus TaxID=1690220 RepID=A0A7G9R496_9MICO|nr:serine hydrolase domain-containing protein [Phycicoccus endophyticus]NHI18281.1 beta-lactamase family protein [Phycicoccus endophyticus]QNN50421.1 beta-lactamase family protein [Phycicoccus endophyticus]